MKTEEQARDLYCPHHNERMEDQDFYINTRCIAGDCMMWRWLNEHHNYGYCGLAGAHHAAN